MSIVIDTLKAWEPLIVLMSLGSAFLLIIASKFNLAFQSPIHTLFWVQWELEHFVTRHFTLCDQICQKRENVDLKVNIDSYTSWAHILKYSEPKLGRRARICCVYKGMIWRRAHKPLVWASHCRSCHSSI